MRRLVIVLLLCCARLHVAAQKVSGSFSDKSIVEVLDTLTAQQSEYTISYVHNQLEDIRVTANIKKMALPKAVEQLCQGHPVKVKVSGDVILVQKKPVEKVADTYIWTSVEDAFLQTPLFGVHVQLLSAADSTVVMDSMRVNQMKDKNGRITEAQIFTKVKCGKYILHGRLEGYDDGWLSFEAQGGNGINKLSPLQLRKMSTINLDDVAVAATKVKMFYKGDTIVYNADAFNLPEGSMLDELIQQLPGVTMNKAGEIFVNGRKVDELLLGERSFFRGNSKVLLKNLPYYTVKTIKVYEQQSDLSRALGYDVEERIYVMDVNLKSEYNRGVISNVELAGGTENRYLGRAFVLGFSDPYRFTLLANANNVNESRQIGQSGHWTPASMPRSLLTIHSVAGEMDYQSDDKNKKNNLLIDFTSTEEVSEMLQYSELFLEGSTPSTDKESTSLAKANQLNVKEQFTVIKPYYLKLNGEFSHKNYSGNISVLSEQFNDTLLTRMSESGFNDGHSWYAKLDGTSLLRLSKGSKSQLSTSFSVEHKDERAQGARRYDYEKPSANIQHNVNDMHHRKTSGNIHASKHFNCKSFWLNIFETVSFSNEYTRDYLYHPDTLLLPSQLDALQAITDRNNSYESRYHTLHSKTWFHFRSLPKMLKDRPNSPYHPLTLNFTINAMRQSQDYQRGPLDTLARSTELPYSIAFAYQYFPNNEYKKEMRFHIGHEVKELSLFDRISFCDDAIPQIVKLGNPDMKSTRYTDASFKYNSRGNGVYKLNHAFKSHFYYYHRSVAQSVMYNPVSGVYTYKPVNVAGNYNVDATYDISCFLDKKRYWTWQMNANAGYIHSIDHTMFEGETSSHENIVNTLTLSDNTYIQYQKGDLNVRATGDIAWRHSEGRMRDFTTLNALDFRYGLAARYTLPRIKTTLSADGTMYSRRGYGNALLNTDDFVVNASVSQPLLKGKLIARLEAFDLLHNLSATQYEVNAQGRTETWYRSLPHYVMLHLVYNWNWNPKKK